MTVEFHPAADEEFARQVERFDDKEPGLGERFYRDVIAHAEWIARNPEVPRDRGSYRRVNLKVFPCYIAYTIDGDLIWILAVAHGHRRPGYWKSRIRH